MKFENVTPHHVTVITPNGPVTFPRTNDIARVSQTTTQVGTVDGVPIYKTVFGAVEGMPVPQEGVIYIVSSLVRIAIPDRQDVVSPGELVRDSAGFVIGCKGFVTN